MFELLGLAVLLGLTLYVSTLTYVLRAYSRSLVSENLPENRRTEWVDWLDRHAPQLQIITGLGRFALVFCLLLFGCAWYVGADQPGFAVGALIVPALAVLALVAIFAVGVPHALALHMGETVLARSLGLLALARSVLWPVARALLGIEYLLTLVLGKQEATREEQTERAEQEILNAVTEGELAGAVDPEQKQMIRSIFELRDTSVSSIMTPRAEIYAVPADSTHEEVRRAFVESAHSRIPVYEESLDKIIGVLYAKDLLKINPGDPFSLRKMMRIAPYVPETKTIDELLNEFRAKKVQIAIVLDEYGGTAGVATIEDILEEVVGEIDDEYDQPATTAIRRIDRDTVEVDARVHVSEVNHELAVTLPEDDAYDTIGGFVVTSLGKVPVAGEEFTHENLEFRVVDAEARKINRLRIHAVREPEPIKL